MNSEKEEIYFSPLSEAIKKIIAAEGSEILNSPGRLSEALSAEGIDKADILRVCLVLSDGKTAGFIKGRDSILMVDVNNLLCTVCENTGLHRGAAKKVITDILTGAGIKTDIYRENIPISLKEKYNDRDMLDFSSCEEITLQVKEAAMQKDEDRYRELSEDFSRCLASGYPEALFLAAELYSTGLFTPVDKKKAREYYKAAAAAGNPGAAAALGDYCFEDFFAKDYTKAYNYYSAPGASALSPERQRRLKITVAAEPENIFTLFFSCVMFLIMTAASVFTAAAFYSEGGAVYPVCAVLSVLISGGILGGGIYYFIKNRLSYVKWTPAAMLLVFTAFMLISFI